MPPDPPASWRSSALLSSLYREASSRLFPAAPGRVCLAWALRSLLHELVELRVHANHRPAAAVRQGNSGPGGFPEPQDLRVAHHLLNHGRVHQLLPRPTGCLPHPFHCTQPVISPQHHLWILHHLLLSLRLGTHCTREGRKAQGATLDATSAKNRDLLPRRLGSSGLLESELSAIIWEKGSPASKASEQPRARPQCEVLNKTPRDPGGVPGPPGPRAGFFSFSSGSRTFYLHAAREFQCEESCSVAGYWEFFFFFGGGGTTICIKLQGHAMKHSKSWGPALSQT